jgi:DNA polymerase kappa
VAVGDDKMIMTANYVARKFGVKSGIPGFIGKKLCDNLVFIKADMEKYKQVSLEIRELLTEFDPNIEQPSSDEFRLDVTDFLKTKNLDSDLGKIFLVDKIRRAIQLKTNLTGSCGVACNRLLAKVCADYKKPDA